GPPFRAYVAGSRVQQMYAFAPTSGAALNVSLLSVDGCECVGVNMDLAAVPDGSKLVMCLEEGFAEVFALAD
ncbi:MAG TPA: WS/DGAT domain-containing protein, partial [Acidimicrobiales bacterium]|nr:WS/DGAT domain-containing protein [Acidimicrobiales bacterium]